MKTSPRQKITRWLGSGAACICFLSLFLVGVAPAEVQFPSVKKNYDLVVYDATPGGIACAVRAAREGLSVLLVDHSQHLGGMLANGLSVWDTLYTQGERAPVYNELRQAIAAHYRTVLGKPFPPAEVNFPKGRYEPQIAEKLVGDMVAGESRIDVVKGFYPVGADREGTALQSVTFQSMSGTETFTVLARIFADCSYTGDLAAIAKAPYWIGRESRDQYNEPHAGRIFMRQLKWTDETEARYAEHRKLNLIKYSMAFEIIESASTGAADPAIQAFNLRTVLSEDPKTRSCPRNRTITIQSS